MRSGRRRHARLLFNQKEDEKKLYNSNAAEAITKLDEEREERFDASYKEPSFVKSLSLHFSTASLCARCSCTPLMQVLNVPRRASLDDDSMTTVPLPCSVCQGEESRTSEHSCL